MSEAFTIHFYTDSPEILEPHYADEERTLIRGVARFADGRLTPMEAKAGATDSPFLRDVWAQYTADDLERVTARQARVRAAQAVRDRRTSEDQRKEEERQELFRAKARALEIPEIAACGDPEVSSRIRRSRNVVEVYSLVAVALLKQ